MTSFLNLEDSPMFRNQIYASEQMADELQNRCQKLHKGCQKFIAAIGEAYEGDLSFADSLEEFGAGQDDIVSVAIGGPVMSKFTTAFKELGSYKELLRSQIEHIMSERLFQFINVDLKNVKSYHARLQDCRQRYDKATYGYDLALEKFMSLRKGTNAEKISELEEDLHNSKSAFERCRFNLVSALTNIEAKKKFEFLESVSAVMDAHMRYFKQGYELLSQMEPFIHQVLTYTQQSKEVANAEHDKLAKRIQEFRTQSEIANLRSSSNMDATTSGDGIHIVGVNSYKTIEALMQSTANGEVQIIKQGYLLKRSSKMRDWKRCFIVLDSHGTLYYYRNKGNKHSHGHIAQQSPSSSEGSGVFRRFRSSHKRITSQGDENLWCRTIDLQTSTIKLNAEQTDLRFCFRIISPLKTFTLQAENVVDQMDWVEKVTGVITSLLRSFQKQNSSGDLDMDRRGSTNANGIDALQLQDNTCSKAYENISSILRDIPGNDVCAECGAPEPDWASLNLGIVLCIQCSGVHRNLGVHISKVRSLTFDVKVWEPSIINLFSELGNAYCNSVWEEMLLDEGTDGSSVDLQSIKKPSSKDPISEKEKYIQLKYMDKCLIVRETGEPDFPPVAVRIWEAVKSNNIRTVYRLLVSSYASPNTRYNEVNSELYHMVDTPQQVNSGSEDRKQFDPATCPKLKDSGEHDTCMQGASLLHLASHDGNPVMMELLLQFGAEINLQDFHGRTPLHHCIFLKNNTLAKYLLRRGALRSVKDGGGLTALERAMELGAIADEELFILLSS